MLPSILGGNTLWGTQPAKQPTGWNCKAKNIFQKGPHSGMGWSTHFSWDCNEHQSPTCTCSDTWISLLLFCFLQLWLLPASFPSCPCLWPFRAPLTFILCPSVDSQRQEPTKQHTNPIFKTIFFSSFLTRPPPLCVQTSFLLVFLLFSLCRGFTPPWARRGLESSCDIMGLVRLHGLTDTTSIWLHHSSCTCSSLSKAGLQHSPRCSWAAPLPAAVQIPGLMKC